MSSQQIDAGLPLHPVDSTLSEQFEQIRNRSPSVHEISGFQKTIDQACLIRLQTPDTAHTLSCGTLVEIAVYLSGRLLQWSGADSGKYRECQLRTLVAALALLHHSGLTELSAEPHHQLRSNIAERFNDIVDGRRTSQLTAEDRKRKSDALYLIRLVSQYFSLIKNSQPLSDALPIPILGLVLAGTSAATGQFVGLRSVFQYADHIIGLIPGRRGRYLNLPALQEFTRNAATMFSRGNAAGPRNRDTSDIRHANQIVELVQELLMVYSQEIPSRNDDYWNWPLARLRRGPPSLNKWYFFYGLLDCASQVAGYLKPGQISDELLRVLVRLLRISDFEEFRWKVLEIFLRYETTRTNMQRWLEISGHIPQNEMLQISSEVDTIKNTLGELPRVDVGETSGEQEVLASYEQHSSTHWGQRRYTIAEEAHSGSHPDTSEGTPLSFSTRRSTLSSLNLDVIQPRPEESEGGSRQNNEEEASHTLTPHTSEHLAPRPQYFEDALSYWPQRSVEVSRVLPTQSIFRRGYAHAGLSVDCTLAFFHSSTKVAVYRVTQGDQPRRQDGPIMERAYEKKSPIVDVVLSDAVLAVSTRNMLDLHQIRSRAPQSWLKKEIRHGDWEPSGIAICERSTEVVIAVGHRHGTHGFHEGRIVLHRLQSARHGSKVPEPVCILTLPQGDFPRYLTFDGEAATLACITDVRNSILVWNLQVESPDSRDISSKTQYSHRPETGCVGLTSIAIYMSPASRPYMLCTTSASTDRYQVAGEWSFVSPIAQTSDHVPPSTVHDFVELKAYRQLVMGAVSSVANKFAVMEKTGKILILDLMSHEHGGICSRHSTPEVLGVSLCELKTSRATTSCLRFDPSGTRLYAIDPEGKLITITFALEG
ncbi:MAG: hypothetical protein Q9220_006397 [cf. Caloplaca sp. 1 TL-2023]